MPENKILLKGGWIPANVWYSLRAAEVHKHNLNPEKASFIYKSACASARKDHEIQEF